MSDYVVDASIAVKWLLPEIHHEAARRLTTAEHQLFAPELLFAEVGSALGRRVGKGEMTALHAQRSLDGLYQAGLQVRPLAPVVPAALDLACHIRQSIYDCIYLVLAIVVDAPLVTADRRFFEVAAKGPLRAHVAWIEDMPAS